MPETVLLSSCLGEVKRTSPSFERAEVMDRSEWDAIERSPNSQTPRPGGEKELVGVRGKHSLHGGSDKRSGDGSLYVKGICRFK